MAYRDGSGNITIDEVAAGRDVKRLQEAIQILKDSRKAIRNLENQAGEMRGATAAAIQGKSQEMYQKLTRMIDKLEETVAYINRTVRRYEQLDEEIKRAIQARAAAAALSASVGKVTGAASAGSSSGNGSVKNHSSKGATGSGSSAKSNTAKSNSSNSSNSSSGSKNKKEDPLDALKNVGSALADLWDDIF